MPEKKVLLRNLDNQESQPFAPGHAQRLLGYPGTRWAEIDGGAKPEAAAGKKKAVAAADSTGMPESV